MVPLHRFESKLQQFNKLKMCYWLQLEVFQFFWKVLKKSSKDIVVNLL